MTSEAQNLCSLLQLVIAFSTLDLTTALRF